MALTVAQCADLLAATKEEYGELRWTDISFTLQEFYALPMLLRENKVQLDGGDYIDRQVMIDYQHNAAVAGLFEEDDVNINDQMTKTQISWRHVKTAYAIERREMLINSTPKRILNLFENRRYGMMVGFATLMETLFWTLPSSDDGKTPFGIPYWVNKYPSGTTTPGFTGYLPWSATYCGGLNHANWKNYAGQYTNITRGDLLLKLRTMYMKIGFKSPVPHPEYNIGRSKQAFYMPLDELLAFEDLADDRNDNLGRDLSSGEVTFRGRPMRWVPQLDSDSYNPIYALDWSKIYPVFLDGDYMAEEPPKPSPRSHNTIVVFMDCTYNMQCDDVRTQGVLSTGTDK